jgi:putative flippase GtrA
MNQRAPGPGLDDFGVFYSAARMVRDGDGSQIYDLDAIAHAESTTYQRAANRDNALPFFNAPAFAAVLVPLTYLSVGTAATIFLLLTSALFALSLVLLWRESRVGLAGAWLLIGMVLVYQSVQDTIYHGQLSFVLLFSFVAAFAAFRRGNERLGGAALALLLLKPNLLLVPLAILLWKRRGAALAGFAAVAAVVVGVSVLASGPAIVWRYPEFLRQASLWDDQHGIGIAGMFGWNAFVRVLVGPRQVDTVLLWSAVLAIPTFAATAWTWRGRWIPGERSFSMQYSAMVIGALLVNPHVYRQDMMLMFVPGFLLLGATRDRARTVFGVALFATWLIFVYHFWLLRETGWHLSAPAMAALLALTALASSTSMLTSLRERASRWLLRVEGPLAPRWATHSGSAAHLASVIDARIATTPLSSLIAHRAASAAGRARRMLAEAPQMARAAKFMLVGASGTVVNLSVLWLCTSVLNIDERAAWALAVECSLLSNFTWNRRFTWHSERAQGIPSVVLEAGRYHLACAAGIITNFVVFTAARHLDAPALVAGFLGIVAGMALNFTGCVHFVFRASGMVRAAAHALEPAAVAVDEEPLSGQPAAEWGS